jgi:DNA-binding transcriptional LysR family regulator
LVEPERRLPDGLVQIFLAVVAAERLQIAQPSLTRQIQLLEQQVGASLFQRTQRQVKLTNVGQIFLEQARLTLDQHQRAVESARNLLVCWRFGEPMRPKVVPH